jgi:hypothetical protein
MDDDGYPEESELKRIAEWPYTDIAGMLAFVQPRWSYPDRWWTEGDVLHLSTGGWSGNEDLVGAMMENRMFMALCWISSRRGGHYEFDLSRVKSLEANDEHAKSPPPTDVQDPT